MCDAKLRLWPVGSLNTASKSLPRHIRPCTKMQCTGICEKVLAKIEWNSAVDRSRLLCYSRSHLERVEQTNFMLEHFCIQIVIIVLI